MNDDLNPIQFHTVQVRAQLHLREGVELRWSTQLELSVDDPFEGRVDRTVVLTERPSDSYNRSTKANYPGSIVARHTQWELGGAVDFPKLATVTYTCRLPFIQFHDPLEGMEASTHVSWGRIRFELDCAACGGTTAFASQNNDRKPKELVCGCGKVIGKEVNAQPEIG